MWGFNIEAYSNTGFTRNRGGSSEGELWLKYAFTKTVPKPIGKIAGGLLDGIETQFAGVKKALLQAIRGIDSDFLLFVWDGDTGHAIMTYHFKAETPASLIEYGFLHALQQSGYDLGDQVMIYLCEAITLFEDHNTLNPAAVKKAGIPVLHVNIFF